MNDERRNWDDLGHSSLVELADARLQAHHAAQWLARAARSYVAAEPDDSHTSLTWDATKGILITRPVSDSMAFGLDIAGLRLLVIRAQGEIADTLDLDGNSERGAKNWMAHHVGAASLDAALLDEPLSWDMPDHALGAGAAYKLTPACAELSAWFAHAAALLEDIRAAHLSIRPGPSPVRCWPHHFDIATLISLSGGDPEHARSVGAGLSPGDETYREPYFYISPWPYPEADTLPGLPPGGHWHTQGFTAAVASASELLPLANRSEDVHKFVSQSVTSLINMMQN